MKENEHKSAHVGITEFLHWIGDACKEGKTQSRTPVLVYSDALKTENPIPRKIVDVTFHNGEIHILTE